MIYYINNDSDFLMHHGIKGQKWGERRFQNEDGTLTPEGKARYNKYVKEFGEKTAKRLIKDQNKGKTEKQAFEKEYNRRAFGKLKYEIPLDVGEFAGWYMGDRAMAKAGKPSIDRFGFVIGTTAISALVNDFAATKLNKLQYGYSDYDISDKGLKDFRKKMNETREIKRRSA